MAGTRSLVRDVITAIALVGGSFFGGWLTFGRQHSHSRHVRFDFSKPFALPSSRSERILVHATPQTEAFAIGDRIDILVLIDGALQPLILDAVVTTNTKQIVELLLPAGGGALVSHARESGLQLRYRPTVATSPPVSIEAHDGSLTDA